MPNFTQNSSNKSFFPEDVGVSGIPLKILKNNSQGIIFVIVFYQGVVLELVFDFFEPGEARFRLFPGRNFKTPPPPSPPFG